ncbi:MAG: ribonuclease III [Clostridiales bacterium]|nr:ribonuclease III [Clostridiales bacterium]
MSAPFPYALIEEKIGYSFRNKDLLIEAFTHSTYANAFGCKDNERMEYLGDAVLQMVVTEWQYTRDKRADEGDLTKERQKLVCEDALYQAVLSLNVKKYLRIAGSKANVGKKTISSLFETMVAAIYLDGGYENAKSFILRFGIHEILGGGKNSKGALQEFLQKRGEDMPVYQTEKFGKDNEPLFRASVSALGETAHGEGKSKRLAEQEAADKLLDRLQNDEKKAKKPRK